MFMTKETGSNNSTSSLDNENDVKLSSKRLNNNNNNNNNLSPCSLSAAVSSAFNMLKHKQNLVSNKNGNSRNSDVSSNSSVNSTASSSNSNGYNCKLIKGNKRATDSDDELYQQTTSNTNNNNHNNYESYDDSTQNEIIESHNHKMISNDKIGQFYQNQLPLLNCIKYFESPLNNTQIQYDCTAPIARNTPENNELILADYRHSKIASFNVDGKNLICLPQAFEMFLKNLVGGLHTVYTKLKRLDIIPIVCNVEQVRVLRAHGAIQPGVNRCKLIAPSEFDTLYDDCTNSGSRPGRPPKRHTTNDSNEINHNNHNHDDSPIVAIKHKVDKISMSNSLNVRLDQNMASNQNMPPYYVSPQSNKHEMNETNRRTSLPPLPLPPQQQQVLISPHETYKNLEPDFAVTLNQHFNYMHKLSFLPYNKQLQNQQQHQQPETNFHSALAALKLFQPQLANFQNMQQQQQQEQIHLKNYFNEYLIQNSHNQQAELMHKTYIREQEDRLSAEQQKSNPKTYSDSTKGFTNRMFKNNNEVEVNSDLDEEDEDEQEEEDEDDDKFRKKTNNNNNNNLHPLSVEYLIGGRSTNTSGSSSTTSSSRNDSLDVMTNATGSSSYSSSSSNNNNNNNNNYVQNGNGVDILSSQSSPLLVTKETSCKENTWPPLSAGSSSSVDLVHNNTMIYICSLINIVKNSVSKLDINFKNDIENLRKNLAAEKLLRRKCDSKIHHLIRLQNNLQNKLKTYNLANLKRKRYLVKRLKDTVK